MCNTLQKYSIKKPDGSTRTILLNGRIAGYLDQLIKAGPFGITVSENSASRVSAYVHELKKRCSLKIVTKKELRRGIYNQHLTQFILTSKIKFIDECEVM